MISKDDVEIEPRDIEGITPSEPSVAVIIPCYNAEAWIKGAIQSVLDQNYSNAEIVVVDDGSTDGSVASVKSFGDSVHLWSWPNRGQAAARNKGLSLTRSRYVIFLDADDELGPRYLIQGLRAGSKANADMVFVDTLNVYDDGRPDLRSLASRLAGTPDEVLSKWITGCMTQTSSIIWKRDFITSIGCWNEHVLVIDDWELGLRALLKRPHIAFEGSTYSVYRQHSSGARVSARRGASVSKSALDSFDSLLDEVLSYKSERARWAAGLWYYGVARYCYAQNLDELGFRAEKRARSLMDRRHAGSLSHRFLARVVGLRRKERLFRRARVIRTCLAVSAGVVRPQVD